MGIESCGNRFFYEYCRDVFVFRVEWLNQIICSVQTSKLIINLTSINELVLSWKIRFVFSIVESATEWMFRLKKLSSGSELQVKSVCHVNVSYIRSSRKSTQVSVLSA